MSTTLDATTEKETVAQPDATPATESTKKKAVLPH